MKNNRAEKIVEKIAEKLDLKNKNVLEIGCGGGRTTGYLVDKTGMITAIDLNETAIEAARRRVHGANFQVGSGESLNFENEAFDVVIFTLSLHHHNNCQKAIQEAERVLVEKGDLIVIEPAHNGNIVDVCGLIAPEEDLKRKALEAILKSHSSIIIDEYFNAEWRFDNSSYVVKSMFNHFEKPVDGETAEKMIKTIGDKADLSPVLLTDVMRFIYMRKAT